MADPNDSFVPVPQKAKVEEPAGIFLIVNSMVSECKL